MNLYLYNITKRTNSTKTPTQQTETYHIDNFILKDSCSILNPVITINPTFLTNPSQYNYCRILEFDRLYFITDWVFNGGLWEAHLKIDTLGTYKAQLMNSEMYVLRSASNYDLNVVDTMYPATSSLSRRIGTWVEEEANRISATNPDYGSAYINAPFGRRLEDGYLYVKILNNQNSLGYALYLFAYDEYKKFITGMFNINIDMSASGIANDVARVLANPLQYILSVKWCPYRIPGYSIQARTIYVGFGYAVPGTFNCSDITDWTGFDCYANVNIPKHPQTNRGYWANLQPYTKYTLSFYPFGKFTLDANDLVNSTSIGLIWSIDVRTGKAILRVTANATGVILFETIMDYMVEIPVTQTSLSNIGLLGVGIRAIGEQASGQQFLGGTITEKGAEVISNIGSAIASYGSGITSNGSMDMMYSFYLGTPYVEAVFMQITDEDIDHAGRPLCQNKHLNTLTGYALCRDGDIEISGATTEERSEIGRYLTTGFFIE